ncbi:MAG: Gfo/Idh/MocA family oxidoreductase [Terricaulis sp.]
MQKIKLALVGIGKIARDQHLPVLGASDDFELIACASRNARVDGVNHYTTLAELIAGEPQLQAVSLCTPPGAREADARLALAHGLHVLLEKPPAATLGAAAALAAAARRSVLSASWHSRHAPALAPGRAWLAARKLRSVSINWREDIRVWHPGQDWILEAGGMGVFDPGINALSILTALISEPVIVGAAEFGVPEGRQAPLTAQLRLHTPSGLAIAVDLNFLEPGRPLWDIAFSSDDGVMTLHEGGARLSIDGVDAALASDPHYEYRSVYQSFAASISAGQSDCDLRPLAIVADAFTIARRAALAPFSF